MKGILLNVREINLIIINGGIISKAKSYSGNLDFFLKAIGALGFRRRRIIVWDLYLEKLSSATLYKI